MANPILYLTIFTDGKPYWSTEPWVGSIPFWGEGTTGNGGAVPALDPTSDVVINYSNLGNLDTELGLGSAAWTSQSIELVDPNGNHLSGVIIDSGAKTLTIPGFLPELPNGLNIRLVPADIVFNGTVVNTAGSDSVYQDPYSLFGMYSSYHSSESFSTPTETALDTTSSGAMTDGTGGETYLDLTGISGVYELEAEFGSWDYQDPDIGVVFIGDRYYEFKNIDGYVIAGLADSETTEVIRVNTRSDTNETLILGPGYGLEINLGTGVDSDSDVLVVDGGAITIDLSTGGEYIAYTLTDTETGGEVGAGLIRGVDVVIGSSDGTDGDVITGAISRSNIIVGLDGNDTIVGGDQADFIIGGLGSDIIDGGAGDDIIIDLDADALTGGAGRDIFVVRGSNDLAQSTTITDLGISPDGLSFEGLDSQSYQDRIAFNFSSSALSTALIGILGEGYSITNPPSAADYYKIAEGLKLNIRDDSGDVNAPYVLEVIYDANGDGVVDANDILGQVKFGVASGDAPGSDEVFKAVLLDAEDFTAGIEQAILDQIAYFSGDADLAEGAPTNLPGDDSISLFVGVERQYKYTVFGNNEGAAEARPVLVAYEEGGVQIATKFRPGNADEVMLGSRASDTYALSSQVFVDPTTGEAATDQAFGRDTIVERDGEADILSMELSIEDLLVGDLTLTRMERGSEGDGRSLRVQYTDSTTDVDNPAQLNSVDTIIYKQYVDYDSSFRVEGLEMVDPVDGYSVLSLGETRSPTELATSGDTDAVLVGRTGSADTFTVVGGSTDTSTDVDLYISGFEIGDKIQFEGYEKVSLNILSTDPSTYADGFAEVTATNSASQGTVNFDVYFVNATTPIDDDFLFTTSTP